MFETLSIPVTTSLPPLPPYGGESKAVWACLAFCLLPSACFYGYLIFKIFVWLFRGMRERMPLHLPFSGLEAESKLGTRRLRKWKDSIPESIKVGSEFFTGVWPKFQLIIWHKDDEGIYRAVACAWRFADYLVTSEHCLPEGNIIALSTDSGDVCELEYDVCYAFDEIAVIKVHQSFLDEFAVKSARISTEVDTMVRITGCDVKMASTVGMLRPTDIFATFRYSGSTRPGFSGAPYIIGDTRVVAMHLCGGDIGNLCVSASYIRGIVDRLQDARPMVKKRKTHFVRAAKASFAANVEDYEEPEKSHSRIAPEKKKGRNRRAKRKTRNDWYTENIDSSTKVKVRRSRYDPDEYEVDINGHYYVVDSDSLGDLRRMVKQRGGHLTMDSGPQDQFGRDDDEDYGYSEYGYRGKNFESKNLDSDDFSDSDAFLEEPSPSCKNKDSATSPDSNLSPEHKALIVAMRRCFEDTLILYESKKSKNCTPPLDVGPTKVVMN